MKTREVSVTAAGIVDATNHERGGVHFSDIMHYMTIALGKFIERDLSEEDFHRFKVGYSWEAAVLGEGILFDTVAHHSHTITQLKYEEDGIDLTSDGADVQCGRIIEAKATWYGMTRDILDPVFGHYHWQGKAYARAFGVRKVLYTFAFMMGNYRDIRRPVFRAWECTYSELELTKNWDMVLRNRDTMLKERKKK
jgi:hypothetical protein